MIPRFRPLSSFAPPCLGAAVGLLLLATPSRSVSAQGIPQTATIEFLPGGPSREGYESARVTVRYRFDNCGGNLQLLIAPVAGGVSASQTYWAEGRSGRPAESSNPPRTPSFNAPVDVVIGDRTVANARIFGPSSDPGLGCYGAYAVTIGTMSRFLPANATEAQRNQFLASLRVDVQGPADRALISDASRNAMARADRQRADSAARAVAQAESAARQRADSVSRATAAANANKSGASGTGSSVGGAAAGAAAAGATGTAGAAGNAGTGSGAPQGTMTVEQREAAARAAERAEEERRAAEFRRQQEARRERERQDSILVQQGAEAIVSTVQAAMPMIESFFGGLEGTGFSMGLSGSASYLPGDVGRMGFGFGYFDPTTTMMFPFVDLSFEMGGDDPGAMGTDGMVITLGTPIPYVRWRIGDSVLRPHLGLTMLKSTNVEQEFGSSVDRRLLMMGFTWLSPASGTAFRLDTTIWEGRPVFGGGVWFVL